MTLIDASIVAEVRAQPGPKPQRRFPLGDLRWALTGEDGSPNNCQIARRLGVPVRQVQRWVADGGLTECYADRAACAVGLHPSLIWRDWWGEDERYGLTDAGLAALGLEAVGS